MCNNIEAIAVIRPFPADNDKDEDELMFKCIIDGKGDIDDGDNEVFACELPRFLIDNYIDIKLNTE